VIDAVIEYTKGIEEHDYSNGCDRAAALRALIDWFDVEEYAPDGRRRQVGELIEAADKSRRARIDALIRLSGFVEAARDLSLIGLADLRDPAFEGDRALDAIDTVRVLRRVLMLIHTLTQGGRAAFNDALDGPDEEEGR
jgi:hypothetical protein